MQNLENDWRAYHQDLMRHLRQNYPELQASILEAVAAVPRHRLAPNLDLAEAYSNYAHPIGLGQTISQPSLVAWMSQLLNLSGRERVLEIGTGSGYQTAILAQLAGEVYTLERLSALALRSRQRLQELGYSKIHFRVQWI